MMNLWVDNGTLLADASQSEVEQELLLIAHRMKTEAHEIMYFVNNLHLNNVNFPARLQLSYIDLAVDES